MRAWQALRRQDITMCPEPYHAHNARKEYQGFRPDSFDEARRLKGRHLPMLVLQTYCFVSALAKAVAVRKLVVVSARLRLTRC